MAEIENTATIRVVADASGVEAGLRPAVEAARRAEQAVSQVGNGAAASARSVEAAQNRMIAAIQRVTAEAAAGSRNTSAYFEQRARQMNLSASALDPYIAQLRAVEQAQARTASSAGVSAGQISAAMRTVPAQFTDIVTAIQGGQRPLTVLLQQGGQLRDQFGSAGLAARSLGGYVLGLINPYTVATGAVIGLALAYKSGAEEVSGYATALAVTGNAAGATADQLNELARQVGAVSGNRGAAAEAITALTSTGQVSVDNMKRFGAIAADVQKVIGRSVADTAAEFAKLGKAPLSALNEINDKYHFITAATYAQVKALQDQGKAAEAADVAQKAYADGIGQQSQKVMDSLTDWERGWIRIKAATSGAVDAAIDFATGRGATNSEKITGLLEERAKIEEDMRRARARGLTADVATSQAELDQNERAINAIRNKDKAAKDAAKSEGDAAQATQARNKWLDDGDKYLTRAAQLERDVTKARNEGAAAHMSEVDIEKRVGDIRKSYSDIFNAGIESNIAALKRRDQVQDVLSQREIARIQSQRTLGGLSEEDAINQTADAEDKAFARHRALLTQELALTKGKANSIKEQADLEGQIDVLDAQRASRKIQRETDLLALEDRRYRLAVNNWANVIEKEMAELAGLRQQTQAQLDYNEAIGLTQKQVAMLTASRMLDQAARKESDAIIAEGLDLTGERAQRIRDEAAAIRERAAALVEGASKQERVDQWRQAVQQYDQVFQQGFADMLNNGSKGWASFTKSLVTTFKTSVADQIYKMFARPLIVQLVGQYMGISQQSISGEIGSQPNAYGVTGDSKDPISAAQAASGIYSSITNGFEKLGDSVNSGFSNIGELFGSGSAASSAGGSGSAGASAGATGAAGSAASVAGAYVAGVTLGRALGNQISGDYGVTKNNRAFVNWNTLLSPWALGGGVVGGLINRAFGMKNKEVVSQGISGNLSSDGLTGNAYTNWHQDGGLFRSDKDGQDVKALTADLVKEFTQGLSSIELASSGFAKTLGVNADSIASYSKTFDLKLTGDQAKDQQAVTDFFSGVSDEIAKKLVPNLDDFTNSGETASAALQRLAGDFQATTTAAQLIGKTAAEAFGSAGIESAAARERLVKLSGGTSTLTSQAQSYAQNYLTDDEKLAPVRKAVDEAMASLGLAAVQTRDQFKGIVNSLDLTTEAGAKEFTSLMALADAFAQVHPAANDVVDALLAMRDAATSLLGGVDSSYSVLEKVVGREKDALQKRIAAEQSAVARLQDLSGSIRSALDSIKVPGAEAFARQAAQSQIRGALSSVQGGGSLSDAQIASLKKALGTVAQDASDQFGSYNDYLRDMLRTRSDIAQLGDVTDDQLSTEQKSLDQLTAQSDSLDAILKNAQDQIDELKGLSTIGLSIEDALHGIDLAIGAAKTNPVVSATAGINDAYQSSLGRAPDAGGLEYYQKLAAGGTSIDSIKSGIASSPEAQIEKVYKDLLGRDADAGGLKFYMDDLAKGASIDSIRAEIMQSGEYKKLHPFAVGTNYVPQTMPALVHEGERIIPAADNRALMQRLTSPSGNSAALVEEVKALREEVALLREVNSAENAAIAKSSRQTADTLDKWDGSGQPQTRTA